MILDGNPFSFHRHEYLQTIYENPQGYEVHIKGTQMGLTVYGMLRVFMRLNIADL